MYKFNEKTLTASIIFLVINALFLLTHFTWWGCIPVVALALYYYLRKEHIQSAGEDESKQGIAAWVSMYIGSTTVSVIIISALYTGFLSADGFAVITDNSAELRVPLFIMAATFVIGLIIANRIKKTLITRLIRYALLLGASYLILHLTMGFLLRNLVYGMIAILIVSLGTEYCVYAHNKKNDVILYVFLLVAFLIVGFFCLLRSEYVHRLVNYCVYSLGGWNGHSLMDTLKNGATESTPLVVVGRLPGGHLLVGALFFSAGGVFSFIRRKNRLEEAEIDVRVYTALASFLLLVLALRRHSTENNLVFVVLFFAYTLFGIGFKRDATYISKASNIKLVDLNNIEYIIENIIIVLCPITYFHGSFIRFLCLAALVVGAIQFWRKSIATPGDNVDFWKRRSFWTYLTCVTAVYASVSIWKGNGELRDYLIVIVVLLIDIVTSVITNLQNPRMYKNRIEPVIIISVLAMLVLVLKVGRFSSFGNEIEHSEDVSPEYMEQFEIETMPEPTPEPITWQEAYLKVISDRGIPSDTTCTLMYIDDDSIPELWINVDEQYGWLISFYIEDAIVNEILQDSFSYIPRTGLVRISTTEEMYDGEEYFTGYYLTDVINEFQNGDFLVKNHGEYQAYSEWYYYGLYWDDVEVSGEDYDWYLADCFYDHGEVSYPAGDLTVADVVTILDGK